MFLLVKIWKVSKQIEQRQSNTNRLKREHDWTVRNKNYKHEKENVHAALVETKKESDRRLSALKERISNKKQEKIKLKSQNQCFKKATTTISRNILSFSCPLEDAMKKDT